MDENSLLLAIHEGVNSGDHAAVQKSCESYFATFGKSDGELVQVYLTSLIQQGEFTNVVGFVSELGSPTESHVFSSAYALYRSERLVESERVVMKSLQNASFVRMSDWKLLESQVVFKKGVSAEASRCIQALREVTDNHSAEFATNYAGAIAVHASFLASSAFVSGSALSAEKTSSHHVMHGSEWEALLSELGKIEQQHAKSSFEFVFNSACVYLFGGHLGRAISEIRRALSIAEENLAHDGLSAAEIQQETAPLSAQLAYALLVQGNVEQARELTSEVLARGSLSSKQLIAVLRNNLLVINQDDEAQNNAKKLKSLFAQIDLSKLNADQKTAVYENQACILAKTGKWDALEAAIQDMPESVQQSRTIRVVRASQLIAQSKFDEAFALCASDLDSTQKLPLEDALLMVQVLVQQRKFHEALLLISADRLQDPSAAYLPGVVAVSCSIFKQMANKQSSWLADSFAVLDKAIAFWSQQKPRQSAFVDRLSRARAFLALQAGDFPAAVRAWKALETQLSEAESAQVALVNSFADAKASLPIVASSSLAVNQSIVDECLQNASLRASRASSRPAIDIDYHSAQPSAMSMGGTQQQQQQPLQAEYGSLAAGAVDEKQQPAKRKRNHIRHRKAKHIDPARPADPERWKPLVERSYFKKGKKPKNSQYRSTVAQPAHVEIDVTAISADAKIIRKDSKKTKKKGGKW
eukprot:ANDGO_08237.mRNA.1 Signal recognition particle subunit SRP72